MSDRYTIESRPAKVCGADVTRYYVIDTTTGTDAHMFPNLNEATERAELLNSGGTPPTPQGVSAGRTGWSRASRARRGSADPVSRVMADSFGLVSPAPAGTCHYCGLPSRSCDCY